MRRSKGGKAFVFGVGDGKKRGKWGSALERGKGDKRRKKKKKMRACLLLPLPPPPLTCLLEYHLTLLLLLCRKWAKGGKGGGRRSIEPWTVAYEVKGGRKE